jgi:hypothetical protein
MNLYDNLSKFEDYLISIRKAEKFFFIDLAFPKTWVIPQKYMTDNFVFTFVIKNDENNTGITFIIENTQDIFAAGLDKVFKIIEDNKEIEQKSSLLNKSIDKLKLIFNKNKLDDLNQLEFILPKPKVKAKAKDDTRRNPELVEQGNQEGQN